MIKRQKVFDTYWRFAAERQEIFFNKLTDAPPPYSNDTIFNNYKFCNSYRASDRVSQYLIKEVIYQKKRNDLDSLFRIFLFRLLNKVESWMKLEDILGEITLNDFSVNKYEKAVMRVKNENKVLYGNAFILCANKAYGFDQKYLNHLALLEEVFIKTDKGLELAGSKSLQKLFEELKKLPLIGNFMAYQLAIDFNYSEVFDFSENDFTCAGPGAVRGIQKCFEDIGTNSFEDVIMWMVENQDQEFERLGIRFKNLFGRKLTAIDCQNIFCETDKYCRVRFPELKSGRVKIKSIYKPNPEKIEYFYPPKWGINENIKKFYSESRTGVEPI